VAADIVVLRTGNASAFHCLVLADMRIGKDPIFPDQQVDGQSGKGEEKEECRNYQ